jgi:homoserine O-succinyltransferase
VPVTIPSALPARSILEDENVFVMTPGRAQHQDIRPLHIAIVNLMPTKMATETQLLRLLGNTPLQLEISLLRMASHDPRNTAQAHLDAFYTTFDEAAEQKFDGLIITGAPIETLDFEQVDYWPELQEIMDWSRDNVFSTMHVCWGAQAGLYHHHGIPKYPLERKIFGVFPHRVLDPRNRVLSGFDEVFPAPHSRHTETRAADIEATDDLKLLAVSDEAGVYLVGSRDGRELYVTGHPEYERHTLKLEYDRDHARGLDVAVPRHYYPADDPAAEPMVTWRSHAFLLYANWLNYCVYQATPFDLDAIGTA